MDKRKFIEIALTGLHAYTTPATEPTAVAWMYSRREWEVIRSAVALSLKFPSMESFPGIEPHILPLVEKVLLLPVKPPGQLSQGDILGVDDAMGS